MKNNMLVIGNVERELALSSICIGENRWRWKKRYFSKFFVEPEKWINPHMVIVGGSGGGKSNACKVIVKALRKKGCNMAILDPHNEYIGISGIIGARVYDASHSGINMFDLDGMTAAERAGEITGMFRRNFRLGEVQGYMLHRCIMYSYNVLEKQGLVPNIHNLMFALKAFKRNAKSSSERNVLEGLERRMSLIASGAFEKSVDIGRVISGNSVFLLSGLHTPEAQAIYAEGFLRKVYSSMLALEKRPSPRFYIVIDEAERLGDNPVIGKIAAEGRKYGIGIIALSQRAKLVDKDLRGNAAMLASFCIKEPEELNYVANFISGGNESGRFIEIKKRLRSMPRGIAMVTGAGIRNPVIIKLAKHEGYCEDMRFRLLEMSRGGISRDQLLRSIDQGEETGRLLCEMIGEGEIKECVIELGGSADTWYISNSHNSAEHDIAIGIISRRLSSLGIKNRVYNNAFGPDIIAFYRGRRIAVEYETGSKNADDSAAMIQNRKKMYDSVIVVANDRAFDKYLGFECEVIRFSAVDRYDFAGSIAG